MKKLLALGLVASALVVACQPKDPVQRGRNTPIFDPNSVDSNANSLNYAHYLVRHMGLIKTVMDIALAPQTTSSLAASCPRMNVILDEPALRIVELVSYTAKGTGCRQNHGSDKLRASLTGVERIEVSYRPIDAGQALSFENRVPGRVFYSTSESIKGTMENSGKGDPNRGSSMDLKGETRRMMIDFHETSDESLSYSVTYEMNLEAFQKVQTPSATAVDERFLNNITIKGEYVVPTMKGALAGEALFVPEVLRYHSEANRSVLERTRKSEKQERRYFYQTNLRLNLPAQATAVAFMGACPAGEGELQIDSFSNTASKVGEKVKTDILVLEKGAISNPRSKQKLVSAFCADPKFVPYENVIPYGDIFLK